MKGYKPISIPINLHDLIKIIIEDKSLGYRSISDFVIPTLRDKIQELKLVQLKKMELEKKIK